MVDFFDILFKQGSNKPIRRDAQFRLKINKDGNPVVEPIQGESFTLSDDGSLDDIKLIADRFYHCGHSANQVPLGGKCSEPHCYNDMCVECFSRCQHCKVPLCVLHSRDWDNGKSQTITLCPSCHDTATRKKKLLTVVKGILSPFIAFEEKQH